MSQIDTLRALDVLGLTSSLEEVGGRASGRDDAANAIVRLLYDQLSSGEERACALVRLYITCRYGDLELLARGFAKSMAKGLTLSGDTACLRLIATAGDLPPWNDVARSIDHQVIPLISEEVVHQMPMVAQLIQQLGFEVRDVLSPDPSLFFNPDHRTQNVFWVEEAAGSPYIPAQDDFVHPHGIRSVVGFGGLLGNGELFAVVLFSKATIPEAAARRFRSLGPVVRRALVGPQPPI